MKNLQFLILCLVTIHVSAQEAQRIIGIWKGTSICQIKSSPCHDENVVYHISKTSSAEKFNLQMNKIVNGAEEDMGILEINYDEKQSVFVSIDTVRNAKWTFKINGQKLEGTLLYKEQLYRVINATKSQ